MPRKMPETRLFHDFMIIHDAQELSSITIKKLWKAKNACKVAYAKEGRQNIRRCLI